MPGAADETVLCHRTETSAIGALVTVCLFKRCAKFMHLLCMLVYPRLPAVCHLFLYSFLVHQLRFPSTDLYSILAHLDKAPWVPISSYRYGLGLLVALPRNGEVASLHRCLSASDCYNSDCWTSPRTSTTQLRDNSIPQYGGFFSARPRPRTLARQSLASAILYLRAVQRELGKRPHSFRSNSLLH